MVTETRTEYETVEKQVEVTICDCCETEQPDEQIETVAVRPEYERMSRVRAVEMEMGVAVEPDTPADHHHPPDRRSLPSVGELMDQAFMDRGPSAEHTIGNLSDEQKELLLFEIRELGSKLGDIRTIPEGKLAADCTFDVCHGCLETHLDVVPTGDHVSDVSVKEREQVVEAPELIGNRLLVAGVLASSTLVVGGLSMMPMPSYFEGLFAGIAIVIASLYVYQSRTINEVDV